MSAEGSTTVVTGTLGSGKSLAGASQMMDWLVKGGTVVTNVPMYPDKIAAWLLDEFGIIFDPARLVLLKQASIADFQNQAIRGNEELASMMVLDEAALDISARDWKQHSDEQFNFVVLCRKLRIHLVLIAQDANDIDKRIRQKMQKEINCRTLKNIPYIGGLLKMPIFIRVFYSHELGRKPWRTGFKMEWKGQAWGFFDSHALHGEKAELYGALQQATAEKLQRVTYNPLPYILLSAFTFATTLTVTIICLLANS